MDTRTVGAFQARRHLGKLLNEVGYQGSIIVVEKNGERLGALVPLRVLDYWEKGREAFFAEMRRIGEASALSEEEAMQLANEAVAAVRAEKRAEKKERPSHD